jgi:hypothetical protein
MTDQEHQLKLLEAQAPAKEIASKSIGKHGLAYITAIVLIGVGSSYFLSESAITAVMTMVGGALVALIQMLKGITDTQEKQEKPEFKLMHEMLSRMDKQEPPMRVDVEGDRVTVRKGDDTITTKAN